MRKRVIMEMEEKTALALVPSLIALSIDFRVLSIPGGPIEAGRRPLEPAPPPAVPSPPTHLPAAPTEAVEPLSPPPATPTPPVAEAASEPSIPTLPIEQDAPAPIGKRPNRPHSKSTELGPDGKPLTAAEFILREAALRPSGTFLINTIERAGARVGFKKSAISVAMTKLVRLKNVERIALGTYRLKSASYDRVRTLKKKDHEGRTPEQFILAKAPTLSSPFHSNEITTLSRGAGFTANTLGHRLRHMANEGKLVRVSQHYYKLPEQPSA